VPLPIDNQALAIWHLCTVVEDSIRLRLEYLRSSSIGQEELITEINHTQFFVDRQGYTLKHALNAILNRLESKSLPDSWKPKVDDEIFRKACEFMEASFDYSLAVAAFSNYHSGNHTKCTFDSSKKLLEFEFDEYERAYWALHVFMSSRSNNETSLTYLAQFILWFLNPSLWPDGVKQAVYDICRRGLTVKYRFNSPIIKSLMDELSSPPQLVPKEWGFPWATLQESRQFMKALQAWCMYHLLMVHFGSLHLSVKGLGVASLCPVIGQRQFVREMAILSDLKTSTVENIIQFLELGIAVDTPDPVLQPLIPVAERVFAIPAMNTISSAYERNLLVLHARVDKPSFDLQSKSFEEGMTQTLIQTIGKRFPFHKTNTFIPFQGQAGEVDLIIADPMVHTILVGELRWFLPPGDPREHIIKKKECIKKVQQLKPKVLAVQKNSLETLELLGVSSREIDKSDWAVVGVVIVDGYSGVLSPTVDIPIVPQYVFIEGIQKCANLHVFHDWLCSLVWLPQNKTHFVYKPVEANFGEYRLQWEATDIQGQAEDYLRVYLPGSIENFSQILSF